MYSSLKNETASKYGLEPKIRPKKAHSSTEDDLPWALNIETYLGKLNKVFAI